MATTPKPKLLPQVKYNPPPPAAPPQQPPVPPPNFATLPNWNADTGGYSSPPVPYQQPDVTGSVTVGPDMNKLPAGTYQDNTGAWRLPNGRLANEPPESGSATPQGGWASANQQRPNWMEDPNMNGANQPHGAALPPTSALTNNRTNYDTAKDAGDTASMARLQAEWERIAPLAQQHGITAERLVKSYMDPSNPAAKSDLGSALGAAIADDVWGNEATNAFGRPPNDLEWRQHWEAMNKGGRDPLEGHAQSVQNIQAAMQQMQNQNQSVNSTEYQQWLANQH